jgi:hypothetical protein
VTTCSLFAAAERLFDTLDLRCPRGRWASAANVGRSRMGAPARRGRLCMFQRGVDQQHRVAAGAGFRAVAVRLAWRRGAPENRPVHSCWTASWTHAVPDLATPTTVADRLPCYRISASRATRAGGDASPVRRPSDMSATGGRDEGAGPVRVQGHRSTVAAQGGSAPAHRKGALHRRFQHGRPSPGHHGALTPPARAHPRRQGRSPRDARRARRLHRPGLCGRRAQADPARAGAQDPNTT